MKTVVFLENYDFPESVSGRFPLCCCGRDSFFSQIPLKGPSCHQNHLPTPEQLLPLLFLNENSVLPPDFQKNSRWFRSKGPPGSKTPADPLDPFVSQRQLRVSCQFSESVYVQVSEGMFLYLGF